MGGTNREMNKRNQTPVENLVPPDKSVWKPTDLSAEPILKEFLLQVDEFPELPKSRRTAYNFIRKSKKEDSYANRKSDRKGEVSDSESDAEEIVDVEMGKTGCKIVGVAEMDVNNAKEIIIYPVAEAKYEYPKDENTEGEISKYIEANITEYFKETTADEVEEQRYNSQTKTAKDQATFEQPKDTEDKIFNVQKKVRIEVPGKQCPQEVHILDSKIWGVARKAVSKENGKETNIEEEMESGDNTDPFVNNVIVQTINGIHVDTVEKDKNLWPRSAPLLEANAIEVTIQTTTFLEHCFTTTNLGVIKKLKIEDYKEILYVFNSGGARQLLLIMNYVDHMFTYPRAIIMGLSYGVKKLSTLDWSSDEVSYWVERKFCCFVLSYTFKLKLAVEPLIPYSVERGYLILGSVDDEGTLNIVDLKFSNGNIISERVYKRASLVFSNQTSEKVACLRCCIFYLAREKGKEEEMMEFEGPLGKSDIVNRELISLERKLSTLYKNKSVNVFSLYECGLVLKEEGNVILARTVLVDAINDYLWNWSAWFELQTLYTKIEALSNLHFNIHARKDFFLAQAYHELRLHKESFTKYEYLQGTFSCGNYIQSQIAKAQCNLKKFEEVTDILEGLLRNDPYRIEDMRMYSNVLYAKECFSAFNYLAYQVFLTNKYRSESYSIIGNYNSLKGLHENSIKYFRQDLKLNKKCLLAWILRSHKCVEKKNTSVAIGAWQGAVDIIPCDCRAWHRLGQAYEMIFMSFYALAYLKRSTILQPKDFHLWIAMAQCDKTEQIHMLDEAIKICKRAANCNDREAIALHQLAQLQGELGRTEVAAFDYKKDLEGMKNRTSKISINQHMSKEVFLWMDVRYSLQSEQQISKQYKLGDMGRDSTVVIWMANNLPCDVTIGVDPWYIFVDTSQKWLYALSKTKMRLIGTYKIWEVAVWTSRPPPGLDTIVVGTFEFAGNSIKEKVKELKEKLVPEKTDVALTAVLRIMEQKLSRGYSKADSRLANEGQPMILSDGDEDEDKGINASISAELIFAPVDAFFSDDVSSLLSNYRILPRDAKSVMAQPFQFALETSFQDNVTTMTKQYIQSLISAAQRVALALFLFCLGSHVGLYIPPGTPYAQTLTCWICQSYFCSTTYNADGLNCCMNDRHNVLETVARVKTVKTETNDEESRFFNYFLNTDPWGQGSKNGRSNVTTLACCDGLPPSNWRTKEE